MNTLRRGLKRKEPGGDCEETEYQAGLTQFQAMARKRESIRLKLQMGAAPGVLEKDLDQKIKVEESVCKVGDGQLLFSLLLSCRVSVSSWLPVKLSPSVWRPPRICCLDS